MAEALRLIAADGHADRLFDRPGVPPQEAIVTADEAIKALEAAGLVGVKRDEEGEALEMIVTAAGTKALARANLFLEVAARAGHEAARARLGHAVVDPGEAWLDLPSAERMVFLRGAREVLAGGPVREGLFPTGYGLEPLFARVVVAAFGEGS